MHDATMNGEGLVNGGMRNIVVSQTGNGDFKSISKAVEAAQPGAIIYIKSGYYEEAVVITKPLSLIGDADGLVVITNSDFALLTITSSNVKIEHVALASGLRMPSIDFVASNVEFKNSILWALDISLKNFNPSLLPAREIVEESFLGASMRNSISISSMLSDLMDAGRGDSDDTLEAASRDGSGSNGVRERSSQTPEGEQKFAHPLPVMASPDVVMKGGSLFAASNSFIGMTSLMGRDRSRITFSDCRFDCTSITMREKSEAAFSACEMTDPTGLPLVYIKDEEIGQIDAERRPAPDLIKRGREAILLRVKNLVARNRTEGIGCRGGVEAQTA